MRRSRRFWLSFVVAPAVVLAVGCGDSSDGTGSDGDADSGASVHSDAGGETPDTGASGFDGGTKKDGGGSSDASTDASVDPDDASLDGSTDGGTVRDASSESDASTGSDAGSDVDGGSDAGQPSTDPFDPNVCPGPAMSSTRAAALLAGASRSAIATADLLTRDRSCPVDGGACSAWSPTVPLVMTLLTYSGGVTTHYKNFAFPLTFVLWNHASSGSPSYGFSVRHSSDYAHDATDDTHGVVFPFGTTSVMYPELYVWDDHPDHPYDYPDPEWQWYRPATLTATDTCARFFIDDTYTPGYERQVAAVFHY